VCDLALQACGSLPVPLPDMICTADGTQTLVSKPDTSRSKLLSDLADTSGHITIPLEASALRSWQQFSGHTARLWAQEQFEDIALVRPLPCMCVWLVRA
jgi:hypothetical protein